MDDPVQAIVGLGNPARKYEKTRHNVGFWFVEALAYEAGAAFRAERKLQGLLTRAEWGGRRVYLFKPSTYMNHSGGAVQALVAYFKLNPRKLLIVHDDLDLPPGTARLKRGGGHGGHNGLRDIVGQLGPEFARLRLGIGHPGHRDRVLKYVLSPFNAEEERAVFDSIERARAAVPKLFEQGWQQAVQALHTAA